MNRTKQGPAHKPTSVDRYALLQKKVEDLERVHQEGKKTHLADIERLKSELAKYQKQQMDNTELIEKQRKQNSLLEARVQDLKRAKSSEEIELKELRSKLRGLENERSRLQLNSSEVQDLKNSLQSLENKRRDEMRDRDSRIVELERSLATEKKAHEALASQHLLLKKSSDFETKASTKKLQALVDHKTAEATQLQHDLARVKEESSSREEALLTQLEQHKILLSHVAAEFGRLATESVRQSHFEHLQAQHQKVQSQKLKLERKLSNSEAQVVELVHLIRHFQTTNALLLRELADASQELAYMREYRADVPSDTSSDLFSLLSVQQTAHEHQRQVSKLNEQTADLLAQFYCLHATNLAITSSAIQKELATTNLIAEQHATHLSATLASHEAIASRLESIGKEYAKLQEQIGRANAEKVCAERDLRNLTLKVEERDTELADVESRHKQALRKDRETIQRLTATIQQERMMEEALRQEIDKLSSEVQDLEVYEQAYEILNNRVSSLISRNKIAEDEATQLSQCNAEILGHHNPAQRIMYVDRIRRELAEAKLQIAELQLEKTKAEVQGNQLQQELEMYTSVMVPVGSKPRTNLTRVARVPLANMTEALNQSILATTATSTKLIYRKLNTHTPSDPVADLTVDELS